MNDIQEMTIGALVAEDYGTAAVFNRYNIDFCCNGNRTIEDACFQKDINLPQLKTELEEVMKATPIRDAVSDYNSWPLDLLADYIERKHHKYVKDQLPVLTGYIDKICAVHGTAHPELFEIQALFRFSTVELSGHMQKEELLLFPYARQLALFVDGKVEKMTAPFGTVQNPIRMMMHEHDAEGQRFRTMRELSGNYTTPGDGCNTYGTTYALLDAFEKDLHLHIHLENNILFPKAIALEKKLSV